MRLYFTNISDGHAFKYFFVQGQTLNLILQKDFLKVPLVFSCALRARIFLFFPVSKCDMWQSLFFKLDSVQISF